MLAMMYKGTWIITGIIAWFLGERESKRFKEFYPEAVSTVVTRECV